MKVLSLKQPFAELVVSGEKTIELRRWRTNFRGKFLVHASKVSDAKSMKRFGFESLPLGKIVGEVEIIDVKKYDNNKECDKDKGKHLANSGWGEFGFILKNARRIKPINAKGRLGFWEFVGKINY